MIPETNEGGVLYSKLVFEQNRALILVRRTAQDFLADDCPHMAAAIAYYSLFSLFPLLLGLMAILGYALGSSNVQDELAALVAAYLPGSEELVTTNLRSVVQAREEVGAVAVVSFLWSAMAVFAAVRKALNAAWDIDRARPLLQQKLLDLAMVGAVGFLFLLSTALTAVYQLLRAWQLPLFGLQPFAHESIRAASGVVLPTAVTFLLFLLVYKIVPNTKVAWSSAALGAGIAASLFEVAKNLFVWYAHTFGRYELIYGSLGAVIGLLMWGYVSALILLLGAELGAEHGKILGQEALTADSLSANMTVESIPTTE